MQTILIKEGNDGEEKFLNEKYTSPQPDRIIEVHEEEILVFSWSVEKGDYIRQRFVLLKLD